MSRRNHKSLATFVHAALVAVSLLSGSVASGAGFTWDASGGTPLNDGGGSWNATGGTNWFTGTNYGAWGNTSADTATFGVANGAAGTITVGNVTANAITFDAPGSGNYTLSSGTITMAGTSPTITVNTSGTTTISSVLAGSGNGLTKAGDSILTLSGNNTYAGSTTVTQGVLIAGSKNAFGTQNGAASTINVQSGATVDINGQGSGGSGDFKYGFTLAGNGSSGQGALINNGANANSGRLQSTNITLADNASIGGTGSIYMIESGYAANTLTLNGRTLTKIGTNAFFLCNTTVTAGTVSITGGTVSQFRASNASAAAFSLANTAGATLDLGGYDLSIGSLTGGGTTGGNVSLGSSTLTVGGDNSSPAAFAGVISGTNGNLTKTGAGILTLSGSNTYTGATSIQSGTLRLGAGGTTGSLASSLISVGHNALLAFNRTDNYGGSISSVISGSGGVRVDSGFLALAGLNTYTGATGVLAGGTLAVNGSLANSSLTVASGATLMGSGTIAGMTTIAGLHLPGNSPGVETFTNLTYNSGASVQWELWGNTASNSPTTAFDQVVVNGNLTFSGATTLDLVFTGSAGPSSFSSVNWANAFWDSNQEWLLYDVAGALATANNLTLNVTNWQDSTGAFFQTARPNATFSVEQRASDVYIVYAAVPEPGTLVLASVGVAAVVALRCRRRRAAA